MLRTLGTWVITKALDLTTYREVESSPGRGRSLARSDTDQQKAERRSLHTTLAPSQAAAFTPLLVCPNRLQFAPPTLTRTGETE